MKELTEIVLRDDLRYTKDHEWAMVAGDRVRMGITDYAQDQLGDIVYVEVPEVGKVYNQGQECGTIESVKAVAEIFIPVGGEVMAVNTGLEGAPGLVNTAPYTEGWIAEVKPSDLSELGNLMDKEQYLEMLKGMRE